MQALLRGLWRVLPKRDSRSTFAGPVPPRDDDDGSAGVREPRRPRPDLPSLAADVDER